MSRSKCLFTTLITGNYLFYRRVRFNHKENNTFLDLALVNMFQNTCEHEWYFGFTVINMLLLLFRKIKEFTVIFLFSTIFTELYFWILTSWASFLSTSLQRSNKLLLNLWSKINILLLKLALSKCFFLVLTWRLGQYCVISNFPQKKCTILLIQFC